MEKALESFPGTDNYIIDTVIRIDKMQKEAIVGEETACVSCQASLNSFANNTLPVSFKICSGDYLRSRIGLTDTTTIYYRIESVRNQRFVTLRLLELVEGTLTATTFTITLDLNCVCAIQCFTPIQTTSCNLE